MGCASSTDVARPPAGTAKASAPMPTHVTVAAAAASDGRSDDGSPAAAPAHDDATVTVAHAVTDSTAAAASSPSIDPASLVLSGILVLSKAAEMCPFVGAPLVAAALRLCYEIFNSAHAKPKWMAEFMLYLRNVETELAAADKIFASPLFCQRLATQLKHTQEVLRIITSRRAAVQFLTAVADEQMLKDERAELERLKQSALLSMLNQVQADSQAAAVEAANITAVLRGEAVTTAIANDEATVDSRKPKQTDADAPAKPKPKNADKATPSEQTPAPPSFMSRADVMLSQSMHLSALASSLSLPSAIGVLGPLRQCYDMWNAATRRLEWQADFMLYLRGLESDLVSNQRLFGESEYMQRLGERLQRAQSTFNGMLKQHRYLAALQASGDRARLRGEVADLEKIKHTAMMSMLTRIQQGALATQAEVARMRLLLAESEAELAKMLAERASRAQDEAETASLQAALQPLDFSSELATETRRYMPGTRLNIVAAVGDWLGKPKDPATASSALTAAATAAAAPASSSRLFWLKGDPGVGKSCVSALLCNVYAEDVLALHLCRHDMESRRDAARLVTSLAYQMAQRLPEYKTKLLESLPAVFGGAGQESAAPAFTAADLFDQLIVQPLAQIPSPAAAGRKCALLIDALDESTSRGHRSELLDILSTGLQSLPHWLGVLVTSRPEEFILTKLKKYKPVNLNCESPENLADLRLYLQHCLSPAVESAQLAAAVSAMMAKTAGLFLYARLQFAQIGLLRGDESNAEDLVRDWKAQPLTPEEIGAFPAGLAAFYREAMMRVKARYAAGTAKQTALGSRAGAGSLSLTMRLLRFILSALEPLSLSSLAECAELDDYHTVVRTLEPVRTLFPIRTPPAETGATSSAAAAAAAAPRSSAPSGSALVSVYHKSVRDWYLDGGRREDADEAEYFVDLVEAHRRFSARCFRGLMTEEAWDQPQPQQPQPGVAAVLAEHQRQLVSVAGTGAVALSPPTPPLLCVSEAVPPPRGDPWTPPPFHSNTPITHKAHAHKLTSFATEQGALECALCHAEIAPYSQGYKCVTCAHAACKILVREEEAAWPAVRAGLAEVVEGAEGPQSYDCAPANEAWVKAQHSYTLCVECAQSAADEAKAAHDAATAPSPPAGPLVALSPFLSYALRRGSAHALEAGSLAHAAVFLCHLQYLHMRLSYPGEEVRLASEFARVRQMLARHELVLLPLDDAEAVEIEWLVGGAGPDSLEATLRACLSTFARFYSLQSHHVSKQPSLVYQDALHFPTATPVCQQAHRLLPWLYEFCSSRGELMPLCWPSKPEQLSTQLAQIQAGPYISTLSLSDELAISVLAEGLIQVWDLATASLVFRVQGAKDGHFHVAVLNDKCRLVVIGESTVQLVCLREMADGTEPGTVLHMWPWPAEKGALNSLALVGGDARVVFGYTVDRHKRLAMFDTNWLDGAQPRQLVSLDDQLEGLVRFSVSPSQQRCVTVDVVDGWFRVRLWDSHLEPVATLPAPRPAMNSLVRHFASVSWSKDSSLLAVLLMFDAVGANGSRTESSSLHTYRLVADGQPPKLLFSQSHFSLPDAASVDIRGLCFSVDDSMLVLWMWCTMADRKHASRVLLVDAQTGALVRTVASGLHDAIDNLALSPDGLHCAVACGFGDNVIEVYPLDGSSPHQPTQRHTGNSSIVWKLAYLDDTRLMSQCLGYSVRVWDTLAPTNAVVAHADSASSTSPAGAPSPAPASALKPVLNAMWLSPDGRCLVTMDKSESLVLAVWDCTNQHALLTSLDFKGKDDDDDDDDDTPEVCIGWTYADASSRPLAASGASSSSSTGALEALLCAYSDDDERRILRVYSLPTLEPVAQYTADTHVVLVHCANAGRQGLISRVSLQPRDSVRQAAAAAVIDTARTRFVGAQGYPWMCVDSASVGGVAGCVLLCDGDPTARGVHAYDPSTGRLVCHLMLPSGGRSMRWDEEHQVLCVQEGFAGDVLHLFDLRTATLASAASSESATGGAALSMRGPDPLLLNPGAAFIIVDSDHLLYWCERHVWTVRIASGDRLCVATLPSHIRHVLISHDRRRLYVTQLDTKILVVITMAQPVTQLPAAYSFHPQSLPHAPFLHMHALDA